MAPIAALLSACGGGSCLISNNDIKLAVSGPLQYFANQPESTYVTFQVTNLSNITATNISYSVPNATNQTKPTGYSSSQTNVHFNSNECNSIPAGKSCNLSATIDPWSNPGVFDVVAAVTESANQSTKLSVQSLLAQGTTSTSSNISLNGQPPTCGQSGQLFCILSVNTVNSSTTSSSKTIYVSVLNESNAVYDTFNLVDGNSNNYNMTLIGTLNTRQYGVNTYQTQVPNDPNVTVTIQATAANQGTSICSGINCSNAESVSIVSSGAGVLLVQPSYFNLASNYRSQVITLSNIGNGQISHLVTPNVSAPLSITNNSCGSTLRDGSNCQFTLNYSGNTSGSNVLTFNYNNGESATISTASVNWLALIFGTQNGQVYNSATLIPGVEATSIAPHGIGNGDQFGGIAVSGTNLFLASNDSSELVFGSFNGGAWSVIGGGPAPDAVLGNLCGSGYVSIISSILTSTNNVYISTACIGVPGSDVYVSSGNGSGAWLQLGSSISNAKIYSMVNDNAGNLYAATDRRMRFLSAQSGSNWVPFTDSTSPGEARVVVSDESGNNIYCSDNIGLIWRVAAGNPAGQFSEVGNQNFDGMGVAASALAVDNVGNVYAASSQAPTIYKYLVSTNTWTKFASDLPDGGITDTLLVKGNTVFVATTNGNVYSSNGGSWVQVTGIGVPFSNSLAFIAFSGSTLFAAVNNASYFGYVYSSADATSAWSPVNTGSLDTYQVNSVAVSGNDTYAATGYGNVWHSSDNGSWSIVGGARVPGSSSNTLNSISASNGNVYASINDGSVYTSVNGSGDWSAIGGGNLPSGAAALTVSASNTNIYVGGGDGNVYLSSNNGSGNWTPIGGGSLSDGAPSTITVSSGNVYAGSALSNVYLSIGGTSAWAPVGGGSIPNSGPQAVTSIAISGSDVYAAVNTTSASTGGMVYRSSGGTATWTEIGGGALANAGINAIIIIGSSIYAGATDGNIYVSTNGGNWINTGYGSGSSVLTLAATSS